MRRSGALLTPESVTSISIFEPGGRFFLPASLFSFCEYFPLTKLYVGNLSFNATEESVRALFAPHGTVEKLSLITDRDTGRPRGFGFIEMSSADATRAMQALNGNQFEGRALKISEAQDKERSGGGGGGGGGGARRY
jgi:hypothetical protein